MRKPQWLPRRRPSSRRTQLSFSKIIAPIDGVVGIAKAQIGDLVGPGHEMASISTLDPIRVYFHVSEQEYLKAAEKVREAYKKRSTARAR